MTEFNKNMTDDEFLQELHQLDTMELIEAFNEANECNWEMYDVNEFIEMLSRGDDIRILLEIQRDLPNKNLWDCNYIVTGGYYNETHVSNDIFELLDDTADNGWLDLKDELIEYFTREDL